MEILDGGGDPSPTPPEPSPRLAPTGRSGALPTGGQADAHGARPVRDFEVDLDTLGPIPGDASSPGSPGSAGVGTGTGAATVPDGPVRRVLGPVLAPEAWALAALVVDAIALFGGQVVAYLIIGTDTGNAGPAQQLQRFADGLAMLVGPAAVLSVLALFRTAPDAPRWARAVTGAAVIVSVALLLLCGYAWWHASGMVADGVGQG